MNSYTTDYLDALQYGMDVLANELHETAKEKGFWDHEVDFIFVAKQLAMVHSEVTEVLEAVRKTKGQELVVEELADIIIRVLDLYSGMKEAGLVTSSLDETLAYKAFFNKTREKLHGVQG